MLFIIELNMGIYRIWRSDFVQVHIAKHMPRFIVNAAKYLHPEMLYIPEGWHLKNSASKGWADKGAAQGQAKHWSILVENLKGPGPLGVAHFPWSTTRENRSDHNAMMSYGYVLARAARKKESVSILDRGGGAGHYYLYSRVLLPEIGLDYHCYDLPSMCEFGRRAIPEAHFHDSAADLTEKQFDLVISSSSLHYFENWRDVVRRLADCTGKSLYIARLQTIQRASSFVVVHRAYRAGYTEYLSWCLNQTELVNCVQECGLELIREFVYGDSWYTRGAPDKPESRGFLFRRR